MTMRLLFWILMLLCLLGAVGGSFMVYGPYTHAIGSIGGLVHFLLFLLLGWQVFGKPLEG